MNKIRKEVTAVVKHIKEPLYKSGGATMTVYQGKAKQIVVLLSILHPSITVFDNAKNIPESVKAYIEKKYGVDIVNQRTGKYMARTSAMRWPWPIHSSHNTLRL